MNQSTINQWEKKRLKDVLVGGLTNGIFKTKDDYGEGYKLVNVTDLFEDNSKINYDNLDRVRATVDEYETYRVDAGDIFFVRSSLKLEGIGVSALIDVVPEETVYECHIVKAKPNKRKISPQYLIYLLNSSTIREKLVAVSNTVTMTTISQPKLSTMDIFVPTLDEQQAITKYLDERTSVIDRMIQNKKDQLEILKQLRLITITNAVTKGLNLKVKMKDSGVEWLGKIPQHWKIKRIKNLLSESPQYGANEETGETNPKYPRYIRITDITSEGKLREETFKSLPPEIAKDYMLKKGDVLLARSGATVGKAFRYDVSWGDCCFAGYLIRFASNPKQLNCDFLYLFTQSYAYDCWIKSSFIQSTIQNVSAEKYVNMRIAVPPIEEQATILESLQKKLSPIIDLIQNVEIQMDKLMESRKIIINDAVTGKTNFIN